MAAFPLSCGICYDETTPEECIVCPATTCALTQCLTCLQNNLKVNPEIMPQCCGCKLSFVEILVFRDASFIYQPRFQKLTQKALYNRTKFIYQEQARTKIEQGGSPHTLPCPVIWAKSKMRQQIQSYIKYRIRKMKYLEKCLMTVRHLVQDIRTRPHHIRYKKGISVINSHIAFSLCFKQEDGGQYQPMGFTQDSRLRDTRLPVYDMLSIILESYQGLIDNRINNIGAQATIEHLVECYQYLGMAEETFPDLYFFDVVPMSSLEDVEIRMQDFGNEVSLEAKDMKQALIEPKHKAYKVYRDHLKNPISIIEYKSIKTKYEHYHINPSNSIYGPITFCEPKQEVATLVFPCSAEGCGGFLSNKWCCFRCGRYRCFKCHHQFQEPGDRAHTCKKADIKSAELLMEDTKPCPKCGIRIHRPSGCDHMFCTNCKTGFNYATGQIMLGFNTNPLYHEYMARNGIRNDDMCMQNPPVSFSVVATCMYFGMPMYLMLKLLHFRELVEGFRRGMYMKKGTYYYYVIPITNVPGIRLTEMTVQERTDQDMDIVEQILLGKIQPKQAQKKLYSYFLERERCRRHQEIVTTLNRTGTVLLHNVVSSTTAEDMMQHIKSIDNLVVFINNSFRENNELLGYTSYPGVGSYYVMHLNVFSEMSREYERGKVVTFSSAVFSSPSTSLLLTEYVRYLIHVNEEEVPSIPEERIAYFNRRLLPVIGVSPAIGPTDATLQDLDYLL